jgi:hypothetical protein
LLFWRSEVLAPRLALNPQLLPAVLASPYAQGELSALAGFPAYSVYFSTLRSPVIVGTELTIGRLLRLAELVGFPAAHVFLPVPVTQPEGVAR